MSGTPRRLLVYVRPWSVAFLTYFARRSFPDAQITVISDFKGLGDVDLTGAFAARLTGGRALEWPAWASMAHEYEILRRSFFLRSLQADEARRWSGHMARCIDEAVERVQPDAMIGISGDSYVTDLLCRACRARQAPFLGLIPSPVPGYTRVTGKGEVPLFRDVAAEEIDAALGQLRKPEFRPPDLSAWLQRYGKLFRLNRAIREKPKRWVFPVVGWWKGDPYNYHYRASALGRVSILSQAIFADRFFDARWRETLDADPRPRLYLPLPVYPESTTDYHVTPLEMLDFEGLLHSVLRLADADQGFRVIVKEHPGMLGARPPGFYRTLQPYRSVTLVSGDVSSNEVLAASHVVLTWTGTVGLEALARGIPVVTLGRPY